MPSGRGEVKFGGRRCGPRASRHAAAFYSIWRPSHSTVETASRSLRGVMDDANLQYDHPGVTVTLRLSPSGQTSLAPEGLPRRRGRPSRKTQGAFGARDAAERRRRRFAGGCLAGLRRTSQTREKNLLSNIPFNRNLCYKKFLFSEDDEPPSAPGSGVRRQHKIPPRGRGGVGGAKGSFLRCKRLKSIEMRKLTAPGPGPTSPTTGGRPWLRRRFSPYASRQSPRRWRLSRRKMPRGDGRDFRR